MSDVAIVISNYNYGKFVSSAIASCLAQTYPCKIIVVDDASFDNSWKVIQRYIKDGITAVRLKKNSKGNARGKNVGICLSQEKYITCLDSDDMLLPNSIDIRLKSFSGNTDFVQGWACTVRGDGTYKDFIKKGVMDRPFKRSRKASKLVKEDFSPRWSFAIQASTILAQRSLYCRLGLYDEQMRWTIDREMWWRWLYHSANISTVDEYVSLYRKHIGQVTSDRSKKNPKKQHVMLRNRRKIREQITKENTLFPEDYDFKSYIDEVIS